MNIYVAAPYVDYPEVRKLHWRLRQAHVTPTSTWADIASGSEDFTIYTDDQLASFAESNDRDVRRADAMIVLARPGLGAEMFAEARMASLLGIPCFWVGRRTLGAYRRNVTRCVDLDEAVERIVHMSEEFGGAA